MNQANETATRRGPRTYLDDVVAVGADQPQDLRVPNAIRGQQRHALVHQAPHAGLVNVERNQFSHHSIRLLVQRPLLVLPPPHFLFVAVEHRVVRAVQAASALTARRRHRTARGRGFQRIARRDVRVVRRREEHDAGGRQRRVRAVVACAGEAAAIRRRCRTLHKAF